MKTDAHRFRIRRRNLVLVSSCSRVIVVNSCYLLTAMLLREASIVSNMSGTEMRGEEPLAFKSDGVKLVKKRPWYLPTCVEPLLKS
jgi:hypothetical protein